MTALPTETVTRHLRHEARVVHATTGNPIPGFRATLIHPALPGWTMTKSGHRVIVSVIERHDNPAIVPLLTLEITDPVSKARLKPFGAPAGAARPDLWHEMTVDLDLPTVIVALDPAPSSLHLTLVDRTGTLLTGRTVELHGTAGGVVPLTEGAPAVYEVLDHEWTAEFATSDIVIDAVVHERTLSIDPNIRDLRMQLIAV